MASSPKDKQPEQPKTDPKTSNVNEKARAAEEAIDRKAEMWRKMGFTVGGIESPKEEVRRVAAATPTNDAWFDETVEKLVSIYCENPQGFVRGSGGTPEGELRKLGVLLNEKGGMDLMLAAHTEFSSRCGVRGAARNLESVWDGIGDWRG